MKWTHEIIKWISKFALAEVPRFSGHLERKGLFLNKNMKFNGWLVFLDEGINLLDVASLEQRFDQPEFQPESVKDLYPRNRF